jgi:hypothetical protein
VQKLFHRGKRTVFPAPRERKEKEDGEEEKDEQRKSMIS